MISEHNKAIESLWKEVLQLDEISEETDFFASGGDSVMALNMLFQVGDLIECELPPILLFEASTFGQFMAEVCEVKSKAA